MEGIMRDVLPNGIGFEWTDLTYQQRLAGNTTVLVFPLCVLLVFLVLAAQYESWSTAPGGHPHRAAVPAVRHRRHLADRRGQQRLHPDRLPGAHRPGVQERHPDRRVRPRAASARGKPPVEAALEACAHPAAAHPDDLLRLHHGRHPAGALAGRRAPRSARPWAWRCSRACWASPSSAWC